MTSTGQATDDTPWWHPEAEEAVDPAQDRTTVGETSVGPGDRVVLRPGPRRTDAQDTFLAGRVAVVEEVRHDVDGGVHVAVSIEGDPGSELRREQRRFWYFRPDELALPEEA